MNARPKAPYARSAPLVSSFSGANWSASSPKAPSRTPVKWSHFQRGFERILADTGAPVVPVHIDGMYGHPLSCKGGAPFRSWQKLWRPAVTVRIGPPIPGPATGDELRQAVLSLKSR